MIVINIDGADGTGKTTLIEGLMKHCADIGKKTTFVHFPRYDTEIGQVILKVLKKELTMHPSALQMLYSADRLNWSTYEYLQLCQTHDIVFVDRYLTSGIVYGGTDGVESDEILYNCRKNITPNLNIILLADATTLVNRINRRGEETTLYETYNTIEKAVNRYAQLHTLIQNVCYVDATQSKESVLSSAIQLINSMEEQYI